MKKNLTTHIQILDSVCKDLICAVCWMLNTAWCVCLCCDWVCERERSELCAMFPAAVIVLNQSFNPIPISPVCRNAALKTLWMFSDAPDNRTINAYFKSRVNLLKDIRIFQTQNHCEPDSVLLLEKCWRQTLTRAHYYMNLAWIKRSPVNVSCMMGCSEWCSLLFFSDWRSWTDISTWDPAESPMSFNQEIRWENTHHNPSSSQKHHRMIIYVHRLIQ